MRIRPDAYERIIAHEKERGPLKVKRANRVGEHIGWVLGEAVILTLVVVLWEHFGWVGVAAYGVLRVVAHLIKEAMANAS